jgi:hypothetical protein
MDRIKKLIEWAKKRLSPISVVIFVLIYIWWFRLTPWNPQKDCCSDRHYKFGLTLLVFYVGSVTLWWFIKNRIHLGMFFRITTVFFFMLNSLYIIVFMPRIIDAAKYNGTKYYLVSYSNWPEHNPWDYYQLTKWSGFFNYEIRDQHNDWVWKGKLLYDKKTNLVNIIAVFDDGNYLLYTDDKPPRYYEHSSVKFENHLYYISLQCVSEDKNSCITFAHTMYKCELDNTSCTMLQFRYLGQEDYAFADMNEETQYIDYYVDDFLAYSYGEYPHCHVEGCEILKDRK